MGHCEERSDEAIPPTLALPLEGVGLGGGEMATPFGLAMTVRIIISSVVSQRLFDKLV
jgi:hypothetical protein